MFYSLLCEVKNESMRVSAKGQVTIPKRVRDRAGLLPGSDVEFIVEGNVIKLRRAARDKRGTTRGERFVAAIEGTATANRDLSTDEIMKLLRGR